MKQSFVCTSLGRHFLVECVCHLSTPEDLAHGEITSITEITATGWVAHIVSEFREPKILGRLMAKADEEAALLNALILRAMRSLRK